MVDAPRRNEADVPLLPPQIQRQSSGTQDVSALKLVAVVEKRAGSPSTLPKVQGVKKMGGDKAAGCTRFCEALDGGAPEGECEHSWAWHAARFGESTPAH